MMMRTIDVTTAEVAANPTAEALRPDCMPRRQPARATRTPKTDALTSPMAKSVSVTHVDDPDHVGGDREVENGRRDEAPAHDPEQVRVDREQRGHQHERQHPGKDEELQRGDARGDERVDFLLDLHRAELGREGGPRSPRQHDRGHQRAHLLRHGDPHEVRDEDLHAELPELDRPAEGQDDAGQDADQRHDGQRLDAHLFDQEGEREPADLDPAGDEARQRGAHATDEGEHLEAARSGGEDGRAGPAEARRRGRPPASLFAPARRRRAPAAARRPPAGRCDRPRCPPSRTPRSNF